MTDDVARELRRMGNVTPLVSVEGNELVSDERRGGGDVYGRTLAGLENCLRHKVLTGVCTSLCQTNYEFISEEWIDQLVKLGVMYCWFHIYRPVGPEACPELALSPEQQLAARKFVVEMRAKKPIIIIDAYHDGEGQALCPAATGFTHHISPWGDIEPCPVIQMATESIHDERPLRQTFNESAFLHDFRQTAAEHTRGCIILERPDLLLELAERHGARDTTARGTSFQELEKMAGHSSQYFPGHEVPEKSLAYRIAKRFWFNDYGAYDKHFDRNRWIDHRNGDQLPLEKTAKIESAE
uniref:Predicted Fe-S oxidoreductases n=1 Tax=uncultured Rhizobium sp. HF0500_35F13 TaxID=723627 RepID=E7C620_9HYPH|nr:predicted Fe-S oxidoreductases [uncultured Rhizobium sp. HF0500_35F13]